MLATRGGGWKVRQKVVSVLALLSLTAVLYSYRYGCPGVNCLEGSKNARGLPGEPGSSAAGPGTPAPGLWGDYVRLEHTAPDSEEESLARDSLDDLDPSKDFTPNSEGQGQAGEGQAVNQDGNPASVSVTELQDGPSGPPGEGFQDTGVTDQKPLDDAVPTEPDSGLKICRDVSAQSKGQPRVYLAKSQSILGVSNSSVMGHQSESKHCAGIPDSFIIGFEKCGTMTLLEYLKLNPEIMAYTRYNNRGFDADVDTCRYLATHPATDPGTVRVEKLAMHAVPENVYRFNKHMKLIAIIRDPVTRAISHFAHRVDQGFEKDGTIEQVIDNLLDNSDPKRPECSILFNGGMYSVKIREWLRYFSAQQIHIVNGTNFILNPAYELNLVEKFLGVKQVVNKDSFEFNAKKGFYCVKDSSLQSCMDKSKGRPHPPVSERLVQRLKDFFRPYNEDLFKLFGVKYKWNDS